MAKLNLVLGALLLVFLVNDSLGRDIPKEDENIGLEEEFAPINNLCQCSSGACTCCFEMPNFKACSTMVIVEDNEPTGNTTFRIKLTIAINNQNVASHSFPVTDIPPLCFEEDGMGVCTKLSVRREMKNFKVCGAFLLMVNKKVVHEQEIYCFDVPSPASSANNHQIEDFPLEDSSSMMKLIGSLLKTWSIATVEGLIQGEENASFNTPDINDSSHDNELGRIDRNTDPNHKQWDDWNL